VAVGAISSFNSDGYTSNGGGGSISESGYTFVDWLWKAGTAPTTDNVAAPGAVPTAGSVKIDGSNMTTTLAGTIAAKRISANTPAGFSIVTYTAQSSGTATVGHGLGKAPSMIILKSRTGVAHWLVYHTAITNTSYLTLSLTNALGTSATYWNNTSPTTSVYTVGTAFADSTNYVAYCFAEIPGYSKFGSYTGNGSTDGPFVFCGFRPRYVLVKNATTGGSGYNWFILDSERNRYNLADLDLVADLPAQENQSSQDFDILSNGFKFRGVVGAGATNGSGQTYIYAAFAEYPFGGQNVSPSPAR
jgi:hypothetical protein